MNQINKIVMIAIAALAINSTTVAQESEKTGEQDRDGWIRKDDGKIRLATPHGTKSGIVRGNLNVVYDRVRANIEMDDVQKLYTMSSPDVLEVTIVLQSGNGAEKLARKLLLEMYDIVLDSDVSSCKLEFLHGEESVEIRPGVRERIPGPVVHEVTIAVAAIDKTENGE